MSFSTSWSEFRFFGKKRKNESEPPEEEFTDAASYKVVMLNALQEREGYSNLIAASHPPEGSDQT